MAKDKSARDMGHPSLWVNSASRSARGLIRLIARQVGKSTKGRRFYACRRRSQVPHWCPLFAARVRILEQRRNQSIYHAELVLVSMTAPLNVSLFYNTYTHVDLSVCLDPECCEIRERGQANSDHFPPQTTSRIAWAEPLTVNKRTLPNRGSASVKMSCHSGKVRSRELFVVNKTRSIKLV
jgi:hypothetical protein